jgi:hypothetical protein
VSFERINSSVNELYILLLCVTRSATATRRSSHQLQSAFHEKVSAGRGGSGAVRGESLLVGGLKGCYL